MPESEPLQSLECGWCGCEAVVSEDGLFGEDMASQCMTCGFPGHVSLEEDLMADWDEENEEPRYIAYWTTEDTDENVQKWIAAHPDDPLSKDPFWFGGE